MTDLAETEVRDTDLAALVGCTARYVRKLAQDGVIERAGRNTFKLGTISTIIQHLHRSQGTAAQLVAERVRKLKADATLAELQLAKEKGAVALVEEFERAQNLRNAITRTNMMLIPSRAVLQLLGETDERRFRDVLTAEIRAALKQAADAKLEELPDHDHDEHDEGDEGDEGAAGRD